MSKPARIDKAVCHSRRRLTKFKHELNKNRTAKTLVLMEGVSSYINVDTFSCFLSLLARELSDGSRVAYDFKLRGVADSFGSGGEPADPFDSRRKESR